MAQNATSRRRPDASASAPASPSDLKPASAPGFGLSHALVIIACVITAAVLAELGMDARDVLLLIGGAAGIGAAVVVAVGTGGRTGGLGRLLRAYLNSGS
ncbi:hypothetical protein [Streptomyces sp. NPDC021020]|uniref:hypothetical protein n=1 Tax=Streptomyces sp. NPDC021020 TaxID=3365109 RepID=UPI0037BA6398